MSERVELERAETCEGCRYWEPNTGPNESCLGECHRHAPKPSATPDHTAWWPITGSEDWCGEFRPRPPVIPED